MDFWATWCPPCRMSLPRLQEFDAWVRNEKLPVTVLAVNTGERVAGREGRRGHTAKFWGSQGFTMTNVMDYDDAIAIAYAATGLPHMVVIGPDGVILEVERGFNPAVFDRLKKVVRGG
jgi:cytochrome c-type biogenesis protein